MPKRIKSTGIVILVLMILLVARLAQIQLISPGSFSSYDVNLIEESVRQRTHSFTFHDGRGLLLDSSGNSLSADKKLTVVLFPFLKNADAPIKKLSAFLGVNEKEIMQQLIKAEKPFALDLNKEISLDEMKVINSWKIEGLYAQWVSLRKPQVFANHFIGAVGEDEKLLKENYPEKWETGTINRTTRTGKNGIQAAFDPFLISEGESQYVYHVDRSGAPLFGLDVKLRTPENPLYPLQVKTTLNSRIQQIIEDSITDAGIKSGGAVLLDTESSNVLAMASRPIFTAKNVFEPEYQNQMLKAHPPGSVFKIVTAAAALESGTGLTERFDCSKNIYGKKDERDLGMLDLEESFTQSCNSAFASLAQKLYAHDSGFFDIYAQKLGLFPTAGWTGEVYHYSDFRHFPEEDDAQIWGKLNKHDRNAPLAVSQTAIGQLNVKVTPLAAANMMAAIARGGQVMEARAAASVLYSDGAEMVTFPLHKRKAAVSPYTIMKLQSMLRHVVTDEAGTGQALAALPYAVAGKSGTAEKDGVTEDVKWFAGYFPAQAPKYALVVLDLKHDDQNKVLKAFSSMVKEIYILDRESLPR
ncbi:peptidoglycan D,D-transpeptidase FtsI family protein [Fictibacillus aquaticus]|uniref:peptidoglycan D,D-transpeptidase FtsI family protein n=1 Tax=Fictibacillus aquaticus TaxID=2021314 RepID=UPI0013FDE152|nr:penicillin-binding transpeptidase domain-containing protein [Fictibacillus aquaticus]